MLQHLFGEFLRSLVRHVAAQPAGVQASLVHSHQSDGGEMIVKTSEISLGVRIKSFVQKLGDHFTFDMQGSGGNIHHMIQPAVEFLRCLGKVGDPGHIDGDNAHGTCAFP